MNALEEEMAEFMAWMAAESTSDEVRTWDYSTQNMRSSGYPEQNNMFVAYMAGKARARMEAELRSKAKA